MFKTLKYLKLFLVPYKSFIIQRRFPRHALNFILRDFPLHLDIESTSVCNIKCTFCDKLLMTIDQLIRIIFSVFDAATSRVTQSQFGKTTF